MVDRGAKWGSRCKHSSNSSDVCRGRDCHFPFLRVESKQLGPLHIGEPRRGEEGRAAPREGLSN